MTTPEEAVAIAQEFLDSRHPGENLVVFFAEDMGPAYVCHFNTQRYLVTRDPADALGPGPGPICVPKDGSEAWSLGSAPSFEQQIAKKYGPAPRRPRWPLRAWRGREGEIDRP